MKEDRRDQVFSVTEYNRSLAQLNLGHFFFKKSMSEYATGPKPLKLRFITLTKVTL